MRSMEELIVMIAIIALAFGLGYLVRACFGTIYVLIDEIPESLRADLRAANMEREIAQWREDGFLADVIAELYRLLKNEKLQQTIEEWAARADAMEDCSDGCCTGEDDNAP